MEEKRGGNRKLFKEIFLKRNHYLQTKRLVKEQEVYNLVRDFFKEYLTLDYEFTEDELMEELKKVYLDNNSRNHLKRFLDNAFKIQYSDNKLEQRQLRLMLQDFKKIVSMLISDHSGKKGFWGKLFGKKENEEVHEEIPVEEKPPVFIPPKEIKEEKIIEKKIPKKVEKVQLEEEHTANIIMLDAEPEKIVEGPTANWADDHPKGNSKKSEWVDDSKTLNKIKSEWVTSAKTKSAKNIKPNGKTGSSSWNNTEIQKGTNGSWTKAESREQGSNGQWTGKDIPKTPVAAVTTGKKTNNKPVKKPKVVAKKKLKKTVKKKVAKKTVIKKVKKAPRLKTVKSPISTNKVTKEEPSFTVEAPKDFPEKPDDTTIVEEAPLTTENRIEKMINDIEPLLNSDLPKAKEIYKKINIHYQYLDEDNKLKYYDKIHHLYKKITQGF